MRFNIFLVFPLLLFSGVINANNRPGFVCGKFNGNVIEVPNEYVYMPVEYQGYSFFDPKFIENKKGCNENYRELTLMAYWPHMRSVDVKEKYKTESDEKIIKIILKPIRENEYSLAQKMSNYLNASYLGRRSQIFYDDDADLKYIEYYETYNENKSFDNKNSQKKKVFFWSENEHEVEAILECLWLPLENKYLSCNMIFSIQEISILVEVRFGFNNYNQWSDIINRTKLFIINYVKDKLHD